MVDMSTQSHDPSIDFSTTRQRLSELVERESELADSERLPGLDAIASGLEQLIEAMEGKGFDDEAQRTRAEVLLQGLDAIIAYFAPEPVVHEAPTPAPRPTELGLEQFISAFRNEAQKRLSGLSISMMGIFHGEDTSNQALESSAGHLHAIRGGAAMLNLTDIAEVSGLMEQVLVSMRKLDPSERSVPTKALMEGYKLLEDAVKDKDCYADPAEIVDVLEDLHESFEYLLDEPPAPIPTIEPTPSATPGDEHELDLIEAARRAESDEPIGYDSVLTQTSSLEGMEQRILIVDDVDTIAASVGFVLSDLDLPIDIASHGIEALEMLKERPYSLIISDVAMPRMDGIALTRVVRSEQELQDIPLILLTSLDHPSERDAGFDAGANDYIIKGSIGGGELVTRVRELLKIAPFVPREAPKRKVRQRILVAEDAETVAASIAFLLSAGDYDITLTSNGHEALTRLEREEFDLLISDWQMPSMTGDELARAVRSSAHIKQIPIILLTSLDSDEVRQQGREAGANKFLVKGKIGGGALLDIVSELLETAR